MKEFQIIYLAPGLGGTTLIERCVLSWPWDRPAQVAGDLQLHGGFENQLTGKYVAWPAVLEIDVVK